MKDDTLYVIHIKECIEKIESYVAGLNRDSFIKNELVQDAVLRNLQVLAESTQRLSLEFKDNHQQIEWYKIAGLRNILVHDYLGIDLDSVWNIIHYNIKELKRICSL